MMNVARFPSPPMLDNARAKPIALGDELVLDFLNTVATPQSETFDWIRDGADLLDWLVAFGVITPTEAKLARHKWSTEELDAVAERATNWREEFRALMFRISEDGPEAITAADIDAINAWLRHERDFSVLARHVDGSFALERQRYLCEPAELVVPVARSAASMILEGEWSLTRKCENPACSIWFRDRTKGHRRRWCSQAACGNRFKVAAFRDRQKSKS